MRYVACIERFSMENDGDNDYSYLGTKIRRYVAIRGAVIRLKLLADIFLR